MVGLSVRLEAQNLVPNGEFNIPVAYEPNSMQYPSFEPWIWLYVFPDSSFTVSDQRPALYTSIQRSTLETIADACPYEYGPGVYMARAMLSQADSALYTPINACEIGPQPVSQRLANPETEEVVEDSETESSFNLYPNPNTGEFNIVLSMNETDNAEMSVFHISGQTVDTRQLNIGQNQLELNVVDGLYLYVITVNGQPKWTGKISVLSGQ